jgi:hypothetical protein
LQSPAALWGPLRVLATVCVATTTAALLLAASTGGYSRYAPHKRHLGLTGSARKLDERPRNAGESRWDDDRGSYPFA